MSSPFEATSCQHDSDVLRDLAYDSARSSMEMGPARLAMQKNRVEESAAENSAAQVHGLGASVPSVEHLCSDCRAEVLRVSRVLRVLFELEPVATPFALDGRVVAATHAGHRQDRATRAVQSLTRVSVPQELELRLRADQAPASDPSVDHGEIDASAATPDLSAPPELDERVALELSRRLEQPSARADGVSSPRESSSSSDLSRSRSLTFGALVAAAALLLLVQLRLQGTDDDSGAASQVQLAGVQTRPLAPRLEDEDLVQMADELGLTFRVRRLSSAQELDPMARDLFDRLASPRLPRDDSKDRGF